MISSRSSSRPEWQNSAKTVTFIVNRSIWMFLHVNDLNLVMSVLSWVILFSRLKPEVEFSQTEIITQWLLRDKWDAKYAKDIFEKWTWKIEEFDWTWICSGCTHTEHTALTQHYIERSWMLLNILARSKTQEFRWEERELWFIINSKIIN